METVKLKAIPGNCLIVINNFGYAALIGILHSPQIFIQMEACSMVYLNLQDMGCDSPNWMMPLDGSGLKTEEDHLKI